MIVIQNSRPDAIINLYWQELLDIGPLDEILSVEFLEGTHEN